MTAGPQTGAGVLALLDRLIALRGARLDEIGRALEASLQPQSPQYRGDEEARAVFGRGHALRGVELRRDARPGRQGLIDVELSDAVCLKRADLDRHFAVQPMPFLVSPPPIAPGGPSPLRPVRPRDWVTWSYRQDWGSASVQYVSFDDATSPRRDCARGLTLSWPGADRSAP